VIVGTTGTREIVSVYSWVVVPSCAVTRTSMVLVPTFKEREPDADPDVTAVKEPDVPRRTPMVAFAWFLVGVTVIEVVAFVTLAE